MHLKIAVRFYLFLFNAGVGKLAKSPGLEPGVMEVRVLSPVFPGDEISNLVRYG
jgi:acyl dehydratase